MKPRERDKIERKKKKKHKNDLKTKQIATKILRTKFDTKIK